MSQEDVVKSSLDRVRLETPRLLLRAAVNEDAPYLFEAFRNPDAMRYWSEPPHASLTRTQTWLASMTASAQNGVTDFVICLKPTLEPIGKMGVWSGDEMGFILHPGQWRKGLAIEALHVVLPHLFERMDLESVSADVDPKNQASLGILEKIGFERERYAEKTLQVGGEWVDSVYLRLTRERWRQREKSG